MTSNSEVLLIYAKGDFINEKVSSNFISYFSFGYSWWINSNLDMVI
ncbi:hypothetical protein [Clostridium omnivorum]|nr:hypothetical protein [Clostridium sp. E14]